MSLQRILMGTKTDPTCCHRRRMYKEMMQDSSNNISSTLLDFIVGDIGLYETLATRVSLNRQTSNFAVDSSLKLKVTIAICDGFI